MQSPGNLLFADVCGAEHAHEFGEAGGQLRLYRPAHSFSRLVERALRR